MIDDLTEIPSIEEVLAVSEEAIKEKRRKTVAKYMSDPDYVRKVRKSRQEWYAANKHKRKKRGYDPVKYAKNREYHIRKSREYYLNNKDVISQRLKQKRREQSEEYKRKYKEYYRANRESILQRSKESYRRRMSDPAVREKVNLRSRQRYWENRDAAVEKSRSYYARNADKIKASKKARRKS